MTENRFIWAGALGGVAAVATYLLGNNLSVAVGAGALAFALVSILLKPVQKPSMPAAGEDLAAMIRRCEASLYAIQSQAKSIKSLDVKQRADEIAAVVQGILVTLKSKPESTPNVRKFFNYYMPTLESMLTRYGQIENSGVAPDLQLKMLGHLGDIRSAMHKLHANLYQSDLLDMSVQMKVMTTSCLQDGLLTSDDFKGSEP